MNTTRLIRKIAFALGAFSIFCSNANAGLTLIESAPLNTYSAADAIDVKPNVMFVIDDSGSMNWDFMPDWACATPYSVNHAAACNTQNNIYQNPSSILSEYLFRNPAYNSLYYNPAIKYTPPLGVSSDGTVNSATYPSMTGLTAATGGTSTDRWSLVPVDAYGVQSTSTSNLLTDTKTPPYFLRLSQVNIAKNQI